MGNLIFGVKLTAEAKQLVGEVKASADAFDGLGASARRAGSDAEKLSAAILSASKQMRVDTAGARAQERAEYSAAAAEKQDLARYREREATASRASAAAIQSEAAAVRQLGQATAQLNSGGATVKLADKGAVEAVRNALAGVNAETGKAAGNAMLLERAQGLLGAQMARGQISTSQHAAAIAKLNAEYGNAEAAAQKHNGETERGSLTVMGMAKAAGVAAAAWQAYNFIKESALNAARYETLGIVMQAVGNNAGYSGVQMGQFAASVEKSGIAMNESREIVTRLAQSNIDMSHASKLARIAQDAAVIGNTNSTQALETMVHGIRSAQTDVLRTIGINVNFEASYAALAKELHKNVDALTEHEKMQARVNTVMEAGKGIAGTYEAAMGTAGKQLTSMARYTANFKTTIGEVFNEALIIGVMGVTQGLKSMNDEARDLAEKNSLKEFGEGVTTVMAWVGDIVMGAAIPFRLVGNAIAVVAAQTTAIAEGNFAALEAIKNAGDEQDAATLKSASMFRDALDARRAAQASDAEKAAQIDRDYLGNVDALLKAHVNESLEVRQGYLRQLSAAYYPEFAALERHSAQVAREAEQEKNKLGDDALKKRDALMKQQDENARRALLGEKEYAIAVIKEKYAEEIKLMGGVPDAERRINELRKQMGAEITDIQINGIRAVADAATEAASARASASRAGAGAEIADANAVGGAWNSAYAAKKTTWKDANGIDTMFNTDSESDRWMRGEIDVFGKPKEFATGGVFTNRIVDSPTPFRFASGGGFGSGIMGEAGPEAVMPLTRGPDGNLGVRAQGGGSVTIKDLNLNLTLPGVIDANSLMRAMPQIADALKQMLRTDPNLLAVGSRAG